MTYSRKLLLIVLSSAPLLFSFTPVQAREWHHPRCCHTTSETHLVSTRVLNSGAECALVEKNALDTTTHAYPKMGGRTYEVSYWTGKYARSALLQDSYERDFYSCSGAYEGSDTFDGEPYWSFAEFAVDNPNLHDDVVYSFALVPMTDQEARAALETARRMCEGMR